MTKTAFDKIVKQLSFVARELEADGMEVDDSIAYEIAGNFMRDNKGMTEYLLKNLGVSDAQGWIADRI